MSANAAQPSSETNLGFARFSFAEDRSMTTAILLGNKRNPKHEVTNAEIKSISHEATLELMAKFPFEICSKLISIMGKDLELEAIMNKNNNNIEEFYEYCTLKLQKMLFLLNPSAFPVRSTFPADFVFLLCDYIVLLNQLSATYEQNSDNYFEVPSQEFFINKIKTNKQNSFGMIFSYEFIRFVPFYCAKFIHIDDGDVEKINKLDEKDKIILASMLEHVYTEKDGCSYFIVPTLDQDALYKTIVRVGSLGLIDIMAKFSYDSPENTRRKIVEVLVVLEDAIKSKCSSLLMQWSRFIVEPRELLPMGVLRFAAWWESILSDAMFAEQLCKFNALAGRLSVVGYEMHSDVFQELGQRTQNTYKEYHTENKKGLPPRINSLLSKAADEVALLYKATFRKNSINPSSQSYIDSQKDRIAALRRVKMWDYFVSNSDSFVKISMRHIDRITLVYSKIDREVYKDFLAQVANDYGYDRISKKSIGRWVANYKKQKRRNR